LEEDEELDDEYKVPDRSSGAYAGKDGGEVVDHADITLEEAHTQSKKKGAS